MISYYFKIQYIVNTISPVFLIILLGAILRLSGFIKDEVAEALNKITFWIALPALLFFSIATTRYGYSDAANMFYVIAGGMLAAIALGVLISIVFGFDRPTAGAFIQGAFRGNLIFIGLPLVIYSLAEQSPRVADRMEQLSILSLSLAIPLYNAAAVLVLLICKHNLNLATPIKVFRGLVTNPLVIASLCGVIFRQSGYDIPTALERTLQIVGRMALPLALISIGASLVSTRSSSDYSCAFVCSVIKTIFCPIFGFYLAAWLGLSNNETKIALLFLACPTAVTSYIMAAQMGANSRLSAAIVFISTLMSAAAIVGVLMIV